MCDIAHITTTPKSKYNNSFSLLFCTSFDSYSKSNQWPRRLQHTRLESQAQAKRLGLEQNPEKVGLHRNINHCDIHITLTEYFEMTCHLLRNHNHHLLEFQHLENMMGADNSTVSINPNMYVHVFYIDIFQFRCKVGLGKLLSQQPLVAWYSNLLQKAIACY